MERKSNPALVSLIDGLRESGRVNEAPIWRDIASRLAKPSRVWAQVNVSKLEQHVNEGENAVVPGKLLGAGELTRPITVAAYSASAGAIAKIEAAGGKVLTLSEAVEAFPKGDKCRIIG